MNESIRKIALLSASPKTDQNQAVSALLARHGERLLEDETLLVQTIPVRQALLHHETEPAFKTMQNADAIVIIFPLYFFCLPAMLTRFLQDFSVKYPRTVKSSNVYAMINCGFPESEINLEAIRVIESFSVQTGRTFAGGLLIGCGGMILGAQSAPFMQGVFAQIDGLYNKIKRDIVGGEKRPPEITQVAAKFPRSMYFFGGNAGWRATARKNGIRKIDLYRKPYLDS